MKNIKKLITLFSLMCISLSMVFCLVSPVLADEAPKTAQEAVSENDDSSKKDDADKDDDDKDSSDSSSNYKDMQIPSRLATAYHDGYNKVLSEGDKNKNNTSNKDGSPLQIFKANVSDIINVKNDAGNQTFGNVGALFGGVSLSTSSGTNNITDVQKADKDIIDNYLGGKTGAGEQYHQFGYAMSNLIQEAENTPTSRIDNESMMTGFTATASSISNIGMKAVNMFNPAPIVLAMWDSSQLNLPKYSDNKLVELTKSNDFAYKLVTFLGDSVPGLGGITYSQMFLVSVMTFSAGLALLSIFFNGRNFGMTFRKIMIRILVISVAIPSSAYLFNMGVDLLTTTVKDQVTSKNDKINQNNLLLSEWAQNVRFGLPQGMTLKQSDGQFLLSKNQIEQINFYVAYKSDILSQGEYNNGNLPDSAKEKVANHIKDMATSKNNTSIKWVPPTKKTGPEKGSPWYTDTLNKASDALGANTRFKDLDLRSAGYLSDNGLYSNDGGKSFTMSTNSTYGLTPIALYNFLNTKFDKTSFSVNSNLDNPSIPTIAAGVSLYGSSGQELDNKPNDVIAGIISIVLIWNALKAMVKIVSRGIGSTIKGGASSAFGSMAGWGELIGGIISLFGGIIGLALLITIMQSITNLLWGLMADILKPIADSMGLNSPVAKGFTEILSKIPVIGTGFEMFKTVGQWILNLGGLLLVLPFLAVPLHGFAEWISELPTILAERAQMIENQFTGDYRAGGRAGSRSFNSAVQKASQKFGQRGQAMKNGGLMLAGAGAKSVFSKISGFKSSDSEKSATETNGDEDNPLQTDSQSTMQEKETQMHNGEQGTGSAPDGSVDDSTINSQESSQQEDGAEIDNAVTQQDGDQLGGQESQIDDSDTGIQNLGDQGSVISQQSVDDLPSNVTNESADQSVTDASKGNELGGINNEESKSVEGNTSDKSVHQDGAMSDTHINDEGAKAETSVNDAKSNINANANNTANMNDMKNQNNKSVQEGSKTESNSALNSKLSSQSASQSTNAEGNTSVRNSASINQTDDKGSETNAKASRLASAIKNNAVVKNAMGDSSQLTNKEQATVGAAHMVAGALGAQGLTQGAYNNVQRKQGSGYAKNNQANKSEAQNSKVANLQKEAGIQMMQRDKGNQKPNVVKSIPPTKKVVSSPAKQAVRNDQVSDLIKSIREDNKKNKK